jgi:hypothetical protein
MAAQILPWSLIAAIRGDRRRLGRGSVLRPSSAVAGAFTLEKALRVDTGGGGEPDSEAPCMT